MMPSSNGRRTCFLPLYGPYAHHQTYRGTLADPSFVRIIQENDIMIWGGDIRDRDAWSGTHPQGVYMCFR